MSLPPATKDISVHPAKSGVTDPTNKVELEADVNRKLKFYGVIQAFREGRLPDNAQIDETLAWINDPKNSPVDSNNLSDEGQKLINDVRGIIETSRQIVKIKNHDELVQNFIAHTSGVDYKTNFANKEKRDVQTPVTKEEGKEQANKGLEHLRTLFQLLLTNSETRKLLSDFSLIGRDLFAIGAGKAVEMMRPDPESMARVDVAASSESQFSEHASIKDSLKGLGSEVKSAHGKQNGKATANGTAAVSAATKGVSEVNGDAPAEVSLPPNGNEEMVTPTTAGNGVPVTSETTKKKTLKSRMAGFRGRVPEKQRDVAREQYKKTKKFLSEEYFPKDRRDQFIYRLKKVVVECQSSPKYKEALEWFLNTVEDYFGRAKTFRESGAERGRAVFRDDPALQQSIDELRAILERFANGKSMTPMFNAMHRMRKDAEKDEGLREWWIRVDQFVRRSLLKPGYIIGPDFNTDKNKLRDDGRQYFESKYKAQKDDLIDEMGAFFKSFGEDPLNKQFGSDWNNLTKDLLFDETGTKLEYKSHLWKDIRAEIIPTLIRKVGYVPIPRIEYTDDKLDLVIENLTLQGRNMFPNVMDINLNNHIRVSPYATIKDEQTHTLVLNISQIQADMRDVAFYFNKKVGFPKFKDSGLADVFLGGNGITANVKLLSQGLDGTGDKMGGDVFKVQKVKVKVDSLKFAIRGSHRDWLYKYLRPIATALIKRQISKAVADGIQKGLVALNGQLVDVRDKMKNPDDDPEFSRSHALKDHFSKKSKTSTATAETRKSGTFKIVPKRESMILSEIGYEKGWVKRTSEFDEKARIGEGWKSAAFSIVPDATSAREFEGMKPHATKHHATHTEPAAGPSGVKPTVVPSTNAQTVATDAVATAPTGVATTTPATIVSA